LVLAEKDIPEEYLNEWLKRYHEARYIINDTRKKYSILMGAVQLFLKLHLTLEVLTSHYCQTMNI
jgi:hypothetical protein